MSKGGLIVTKPYLDVAYNIMVVTWPSRLRAAWSEATSPSPRWWKTSPR